MTSIIVSPVPPSATEADISGLFSAFLGGDIVIASCSKAILGKAYLNFSSQSDATEAISRINGAQRENVVFYARLQRPSGSAGRAVNANNNGHVFANVAQVENANEAANATDAIIRMAADRRQQARAAHMAKMDGIRNQLAAKRSQLAEAANESQLNALREEILALESVLQVNQLQQIEFDRAERNIVRCTNVTTMSSTTEREIRRLESALPFYAHRSVVVETVTNHNVSIIIGETGSGKSTQIAPFLLDHWLCHNDNDFHGTIGTRIGVSGKIIVTQPRALAASELAHRVSHEWGGATNTNIVGKLNMSYIPQKIGFCTDTKLISMIRENRTLQGVDCVIVDEVHERSVSTDILLGCLKSVLSERPDLHVVLTSATMDKSTFERFFAPVARRIRPLNHGESTAVPVLQIPGRTFPVTDYFQTAMEDYVFCAWKKALSVHREHSSNIKGDIIVFLPTVVDVERACICIKEALNISDSNECNDAIMIPLHGKLQPEESELAFAPAPEGKRKIIFSTSIAETSVTIDGLVFVIDSGKANVIRFDQMKNLTFFEVKYITKSSVKQRRGRAGRTQPGVCYHLYSEETYLEMEESQIPEIQRTNLAMSVLRIVEMFGDVGGSVHEFDFVERPSYEALQETLDNLLDLEAIEIVTTNENDNEVNIDNVENQRRHQRHRITALGVHSIRLEKSPEMVRMLFHGMKSGIQSAVLIVTSILAVGGFVFVRPTTSTTNNNTGINEDSKDNADSMRASFASRSSVDRELYGDWVTYWEVYTQWKAIPERQRKRWCRQNYIMSKTLKYAERNIQTTLEALNRLGIGQTQEGDNLTCSEIKERLRRAICVGYFKNVCVSNGNSKSGYKVARIRDRNVFIHSSSLLFQFGESPRCVIYEELINTNNNRYGIKGITVIPPEMVFEIAPRFAERVQFEQLLSQETHVFADIPTAMTLLNANNPTLRRKLTENRSKLLQEIEVAILATIELNITNNNNNSNNNNNTNTTDNSVIRIWAPAYRIQGAILLFHHHLEQLQQSMAQETVEIAVNACGVRAVVTAGGTIKQLLFRDESLKVILRNMPFDFPWNIPFGASLIAEHAMINVRDIVDVVRLGQSQQQGDEETNPDSSSSSFGFVILSSPEISNKVYSRFNNINNNINNNNNNVNNIRPLPPLPRVVPQQLPPPQVRVVPAFQGRRIIASMPRDASTLNDLNNNNDDNEGSNTAFSDCLVRVIWPRGYSKHKASLKFATSEKARNAMRMFQDGGIHAVISQSNDTVVILDNLPSIADDVWLCGLLRDAFPDVRRDVTCASMQYKLMNRIAPMSVEMNPNQRFTGFNFGPDYHMYNHYNINIDHNNNQDAAIYVQEAGARLQQYFAQFGQIEAISVKPVNMSLRNSNICEAIIRFVDSTVAQSVINQHNRNYDNDNNNNNNNNNNIINNINNNDIWAVMDNTCTMFGNNCASIFHPDSTMRCSGVHSHTLRVPCNIMAKVIKRMEFIKSQYEGIHANIKILHDNNLQYKFSSIRIDGGDRDIVMSIASQMQDIVSGVIFVPNHDRGFMALTEFEQGRNLINRINSEGNVWIQLNHNTRNCSLFSDRQVLVDSVIRQLNAFIEQYRDVSIVHLSFTPRELHRFVASKYNNNNYNESSLVEIRRVSEVSRVSVNWQRRCITIVGTPDKCQVAQDMIYKFMDDARTPMNVANDNDNNNNNNNNIDEEECFCCGERVDYTLQSCGHKCCKSCLTSMITRYARPDVELNFPIVCPIVYECRKPLSMADINACCIGSGVPRTMEDLVQQSLTRFVAAHGDRYTTCIRPDCCGVIRRDSNINMNNNNNNNTNVGYLQCSRCQFRYCRHCTTTTEAGTQTLTPNHPDMTCADYAHMAQLSPEDRATALMLRTMGGRQCPRCRHHVVRNGGCDHMHCICGCDFCYQCGKFPSFASSCGRPCPR